MIVNKNPIGLQTVQAFVGIDGLLKDIREAHPMRHTIHDRSTYVCRIQNGNLTRGQSRNAGRSIQSPEWRYEILPVSGETRPVPPMNSISDHIISMTEHDGTKSIWRNYADSDQESTLYH
jgi:hypothetical protein